MTSAEWLDPFLLGLVPIATLLAFFGALRFVDHTRRRLYIEAGYASKERIETPDGSTIVLLHVGPPTSPVDLPPVLLVHGLAANHRNNDFHPDHSIARYLHERGRDVWLVTLRSGEPPRSWAERARVRYDRIVEHDVRTAIEAVLERSGREQVDYVGYSMGGMALYGAVADAEVRRRIRRVAILGAPAILHVPLWLRATMRLVALLPHSLTPTIPIRFFVTLMADVSPVVYTPLHAILVGDRHAVRRDLLPHAVVVVMEDMAGPLVADFCRWQAGREGKVLYRGRPVLDLLAEAQMPALFMAGAKDPLGRVASVRAAHDAWGAREKRFLLLGRGEDASSDYSHADMVLAKEARREVFAPLEAFLREEDAPRESAAPVLAAPLHET